MATAAPILARYTPPPALWETVDPGDTPAAALAALALAGDLADYAGFLAHALPAREGLAWATACLSSSDGGGGPAGRRAAGLAAAWINDPSEAGRRACLAFADDIGTDVAAGWLLLAVGWNGSGSIGPADDPPVMPAPYLHAKALFGAVALAGGTQEQTQTRFLVRVHALGLNVAGGGWPHLAASRAA